MKKLKKVCLVAPTPPPIGGIANWVQIVTHYPQDKVSFTLIDSKTRSNPTKRKLFLNRIIASGFKMLKIKRQLKHVLKTQKIDCVHLTTSGSLGVIRDLTLAKVCKRYKVKIVYHLHFGRIPKIKKDSKYEWKYLKKVFNLVETIVTIDPNTYACLKDIYKNVVYLSNPIKQVKVPEFKKNKTILFLGWAVKTKGIEELLGAWRDIEKKYPDWKLKIVGPYDENYLHSLNISEPSIEVTGEVDHDQAMKYMAESSIFALPSYTEGFPNVILEAMMYKSAIIATKVGAIPEMLKNESGILVEKQSKEELKQALELLIENEEKRLHISEQAYQRVVNNYTIEKVFEKLYNIYK